MGFENSFFKFDYHYRIKFVNKCIAITRFSKNERRVNSFKKLVFLMMKDIVKKNVSNYLNLLQGTYRREELPDREGLIADCYIIFNKCLEKYKIKKNYNFYFYFNKSLSRSFFRFYQNEQKKKNTVEITEAVETTNKVLHYEKQVDSVELLLEQLNFNEIEKRIARSRISGQRTTDFLEKNEDVSKEQYSIVLKSMKSILTIKKEKGEI